MLAAKAIVVWSDGSTAPNHLSVCVLQERGMTATRRVNDTTMSNKVVTLMREQFDHS